jgi:hypothetical protein
MTVADGESTGGGAGAMLPDPWLLRVAYAVTNHLVARSNARNA